MRKFLLCLFLSCFIIKIYSQVNKSGIPLITNYSAIEYNFAEQNWCIVEDRRGLMYFGNNENGVLEYDGVNFRKIPISNKSTIRSLAIDDNGVVFVGAIAELGYLAPDYSGKLYYKSLMGLVDSSLRKFVDNVYNVLIKDHKVYFCMTDHLLVYDYHSFKHIPVKKDLRHWLSFNLNNTLYLGTHNGGLMQMSEDEIKPLKGGEFFKNMDITFILSKSEKKLIIGTYANGVFLFDTETSRVIPDILSIQANDSLKNNGLICGQVLPGDRMAFGTYSRGVIVTDKTGNILYHINKSNGLQDDVAFALYMNPSGDKASPLWLALNSGVSKIEINSPFASFGEKTGLHGQVLDIMRFNRQLYIATTGGIFRFEYDARGNPFLKQFTQPANVQCWSFAKFILPSTNNEVLLVGTMAGVYQIDKLNNISRIDEKLHRIDAKMKSLSAFYLYASKVNKSRVYIGEENGFKIMTNSNGKWDSLINIKDVKAEIRMIVEDKKGDVWLGTAVEGIFRVNNSGTKPEVINYDTKDGLPDIKDANPVIDGDSIYVTTSKGLYKFDEKTGRFLISGHLGSSFSDGSMGAYEIFMENDNTYWISSNVNQKINQRKCIDKVVRNPDGTIHSILQPFLRLPNKEADVIYPDENNIIWFGMSNDLFSYDENVKYNYHRKFQTLIRNASTRNFYTGSDSSIFGGTFFNRSDSVTFQIIFDQQSKQIPKISYLTNNITFNFASSSYENERSTEYCYLLKGVKDKWSDWTYETKAVFTNLSEGEYEFKAKARNIYGIESTVASYSFIVLPPWYRSIWAYLAYLLFIGLIVWTFFVQIGNRRLDRMVKLRTAEVMKQKEEIETQRDEIEAQRDEIEAQRDMVVNQKEHIEGIHKEVTDSINYAKRIQTAALPDEKLIRENISDLFILFKPKDIVSGDFYWFAKVENQIVVTVADCTGHGVPGAFMSMLGMSLIKEIVLKEYITQPDVILNRLRKEIIKALGQKGESGEQKDGMDISLCSINTETLELQWSGANNSCMIIQDGKFIEIKGDKMPIAIHEKMEKFVLHEMQLRKNDIIYLHSDGYHDQFGGPNNKKFMSLQFKELLSTISSKPMAEQREILDKTIEDWINGFETKYGQTDDITVMGIKV
jgi:serine phosphatase RsbU (regulator of sigma subunit)